MTQKSLYYDRFKTLSGNTYLYDGVTSVVVPDNGLLEQLIKLKHQGKEDEEIISELSGETVSDKQLRSALIFYNRWEREFHGFSLIRKNYTPPKVTAKDIKDTLDQGDIYILILNVTEDCNFRCKYCYLSEAYDFTRNRTTKKMSFETARAAIDYYYKLLDDCRFKRPNKRVNINFFGGEPLLEFELLKKTVEYAKANTTREIAFNITTNGYLLTDKISDFLVENNFYISVSLDGAKKNNTQRVLANNIETFDRIVDNLKNFKRRYPYYTNIGILSVYDINTDLDENVDFFKDPELPPVLRATGVSNNNTDYYDQFQDSDYERFRNTMLRLRQEYLDKKMSSQPMSGYLQVFFESELFTVLMRKRHKDDNTGSILPYTGTCVPGIRLSVRADGTLDICERMNQEFPIGNVHTGYNYEALADIVNKYNESITSSCRECIGNKICQICFAQVAGDKCFNYKPEICKQIQEMIKNGNSVIYSILEENPEAYTLEGMEKVIENMIKFEG